MTETVELRYASGGGTAAATLPVLAVRGYDEPDEWELYPPVQRTLLDGTIDEKITGFRRIITIDFGVLGEPAQRAALFAFLRAPARSICYHGAETAVAIDGLDTYANEWIDGIGVARRYRVRLKEKQIRSSGGFGG